MTEFLQRRKIKNQITDRDTYAWCILFRLKHAEGKILNRKIRIFCDFEKRAKSHAYDLTTKITEATKTYLNFPFQALRDLRVLRGH